MLTQTVMHFRLAQPTDDCMLATHFRQMWLDLDTPAAAICPDWETITQQFIDHARQELHYAAFVAEADRAIVGSASCQLFAGLYPQILQKEHRKYGYIWGVYVDPSYRQQGIAKGLTQMAIDHLRTIGCTRVVLNASPLGKPVYSSLGFVESNAMHLDL